MENDEGESVRQVEKGERGYLCKQEKKKEWAVCGDSCCFPVLLCVFFFFSRGFVPGGQLRLTIKVSFEQQKSMSMYSCVREWGEGREAEGLQFPCPAMARSHGFIMNSGRGFVSAVVPVMTTRETRGTVFPSVIWRVTLKQDCP